MSTMPSPDTSPRPERETTASIDPPASPQDPVAPAPGRAWLPPIRPRVRRSAKTTTLLLYTLLFGALISASMLIASAALFV